jgi:deoxyribodipyrimidine photolyase-related protein
MPSVSIIFPHQLYRDHPACQADGKRILIEEDLYFRQFAFHKKKLILHRASMKCYAQRLTQAGHDVLYIESGDKRSDIRELIGSLAAEGVDEIRYADVVDDWLSRRIGQSCHAFGIRQTVAASPNFITDAEDAESFFRKRKSYFQTDFYIWQRKRLNILVDGMGQPQGGKWSFDAENREKFPKNGKVPQLPWEEKDPFVSEARNYVELNFPDNPGSAEHFGYPISWEGADRWLDIFLEQRFAAFGTYEDAMVPTENFLFHSVLTPMLNIGLLDPSAVIGRAIEHAKEHKVPVNSLEGFVRQVLGWREFIRMIYHLEGRKQRTTNHFGFQKKIPRSFWTGETGIVPVDTVIRHTLKDGYTHHINRLMILGNFMLLCEFDPDDVYRWFMEMYIDAYDWVMVPNVYGMTQFADGGLMTTKPYVSGSNYLMKMGNWEKGPWQQVWDGLFWRFMHTHRDLTGRNPRLSMLLRTFDNMDRARRETLMVTADEYLTSLIT